MKRKPFLKQLSREHDHSLVFARKVGLWASEERTGTYQMVREAFLAELASHFHTVESCFLPMLGQADKNIVERALEDHSRLRELAMHGSSMADMREFGELLQSHVSFEELELFPALEGHMQAVVETRERSPVEDSILSRHDYIWATLPFLVPMAKKVSQAACAAEGNLPSDRIVTLMTELQVQLLEHLSNEESLFATVLARKDQSCVGSFAAKAQMEHGALLLLLDQVMTAVSAVSVLERCDCDARDTFHDKLVSLDTHLRAMMTFEDKLLSDARRPDPG